MISDQLCGLLMSFVIAALIAALLYNFLASLSAISGIELGCNLIPGATFSIGFECR
jgi:hypothetical protein